MKQDGRWWHRTRSKADRAQIRAHNWTYHVAIRAAKKSYFTASSNHPAELLQTIWNLVSCVGGDKHLEASFDHLVHYFEDKVT